MKVSIVIPALNEEKGIGKTLSDIPYESLSAMGYSVEVIVVDNRSTDRTKEIAESYGAKVLTAGYIGYGYDLVTGLFNAAGDIIVTCDADGTYPLQSIPSLVAILQRDNLQFLTTDRFNYLNDGAMSLRNKIGNQLLTIAMRSLYRLDIHDSQSGMWVFRRDILPFLKLNRGDWVFSQELKIEACYYNKLRWSQVPIHYYKRIGDSKLSGWKTGLTDMFYLFKKRLVR